MFSFGSVLWVAWLIFVFSEEWVPVALTDHFAVWVENRDFRTYQPCTEMRFTWLNVCHQGISICTVVQYVLLNFRTGLGLLLIFPQWPGYAVCQMDQGASVQLASRTRLGILSEFWQALDYIWPDPPAGLSTRPREGSCFCLVSIYQEEGNVLGMWLSGTAFVWYEWGPRFNPQQHLPLPHARVEAWIILTQSSVNGTCIATLEKVRNYIALT